MKKIMLKLTMTLAVIAVAGYAVYPSQTETQLSGVTLDNVEAIASGESGNYYCDPPYTVTCDYVGGYKIPGFKR